MSLYLGTSPIAGSMSAETLVDTLYPVGSCYIGTGATCPLAAIKGTWTLKSSGIVTSVNTNVPCKGNGKTLGITDGTGNFGLWHQQFQTDHLADLSSVYGANVGTAVTAGSSSTPGIGLGITTNSSKSGIVGTVTRSTLSVNIWERTA